MAVTIFPPHAWAALPADQMQQLRDDALKQISVLKTEIQNGAYRKILVETVKKGKFKDTPINDLNIAFAEEVDKKYQLAKAKFEAAYYADDCEPDHIVHAGNHIYEVANTLFNHLGADLHDHKAQKAVKMAELEALTLNGPYGPSDARASINSLVAADPSKRPEHFVEYDSPETFEWIINEIGNGVRETFNSSISPINRRTDDVGVAMEKRIGKYAGAISTLKVEIIKAYTNQLHPNGATAAGTPLLSAAEQQGLDELLVLMDNLAIDSVSVLFAAVMRDGDPTKGYLGISQQFFKEGLGDAANERQKNSIEAMAQWAQANNFDLSQFAVKINGQDYRFNEVLTTMTKCYANGYFNTHTNALTYANLDAAAGALERSPAELDEIANKRKFKPKDKMSPIEDNTALESQGLGSDKKTGKKKQFRPYFRALFDLFRRWDQILGKLFNSTLAIGVLFMYQDKVNEQIGAPMPKQKRNPKTGDMETPVPNDEVNMRAAATFITNISYLHADILRDEMVAADHPTEKCEDYMDEVSFAAERIANLKWNEKCADAMKDLAGKETGLSTADPMLANIATSPNDKMSHIWDEMATNAAATEEKLTRAFDGMTDATARDAKKVQLRNLAATYAALSTDADKKAFCNDPAHKICLAEYAHRLMGEHTKTKQQWQVDAKRAIIDEEARRRAAAAAAAAARGAPPAPLIDPDDVKKGIAAVEKTADSTEELRKQVEKLHLTLSGMKSTDEELHDLKEMFEDGLGI